MTTPADFDALTHEPGNAEGNTNYTNEDWLNEFCGPVDDDADIELGERALRQALAQRDAEIVELIRQAREMQTDIDRMTADAREERYAKETAYQNGEMW